LLGDTKVSHGDKAKLPSLGISSWTSLLVYQWDNLLWRDAGKLAEQDEDLPAMYCIQEHVASSTRKVEVTGWFFYISAIGACTELQARDL